MVPLVRPYLGGPVVVEVEEVVGEVAVVEVVAERANNMLLDKQERRKRDILVDTD